MSKECFDNRQELLDGMMYWANTNGIEIDAAVFFVNLEIEEMVKTKFNPGGPVVMYESVENCISPLMVIQRTAQENKEQISREEAEAESQGRITQAEALQIKKAYPRRPPRNWYELKEMLSTFAALLWVLFGDVCLLYESINIQIEFSFPFLRAKS